MRNVKLAFKLWYDLFKKNRCREAAYNSNLQELNDAHFRLSILLNIRSIRLHRPAVIG